MAEEKGNREFKNSLFVDYFNDKEKLLEMYSAIIGEVIDPDVDIHINTLSDVLFKGVINDLSFIVDGRLVVLVEHQSTLNANMPLRMLQYYNEIIKREMNETDGRAIYWSALHKIPRPEFIVLYNGTAPCEDQVTMHLSDAFEEGNADKKVQIELEVTMYNINPGHNEEILKKSQSLMGYASFTAKVHECIKSGMTRENAIRSAILYCKEHDIMQDYLTKHEGEVIQMITTEWNWDDALDVRFEEGISEGKVEATLEAARNLKAKGISVEIIADATGLSTSEIDSL